MASSRDRSSLIRRPVDAGIPTAETIVAVALVVLSAQRVRLPLDIPIGVAVALVALPVTLGALHRYRFAWPITVAALLAVINGTLLTGFAEGFREVDARQAAANSVQLIGLIAVIAALLWARSMIGSRAIVLAFGVGMLLSIVTRGINWDNPWKFTFSVPVILIVLSLKVVHQPRWTQSAALFALATVSALQDSRSLTGMLLIALALVATQGAARTTTALRVWGIVARIALIVGAGYFLIQAALLEGLLGEQARTRSEAQIEQSGSLIVGGRPEIGASLALLSDRPWGFGSGTLPSAVDIHTAKGGMAAIGYDPNNGYVENYMFGNGFEVHSLLGDLWIVFGLGGLLLAALLFIGIGHGLLTRAATGTLSGAAVFLGLRFLWDLPFSPIDSALLTLPITVALLLQARDSVRRPT